METEILLPCSLESSTDARPEPVYTTLSYFCNIHLNIIFPLLLGLPAGFFPSGFPIRTLYAFFSSPYMLHALPISSSLTLAF
jgi:hypothetical protein